MIKAADYLGDRQFGLALARELGLATVHPGEEDLVQAVGHFPAVRLLPALAAQEADRIGVQNLPLEQLFATCEVIVLAGGYTPETHHMIRQPHFDAMQSGALFVNIARGKMVHEGEMIATLGQRDIYLALDVFEEEPPPADSPLRTSDRMLLVPHRGNNASSSSAGSASRTRSKASAPARPPHPP